MVHANYFCHVALFVLVVILLPYFPSSACSPQKKHHCRRSCAGVLWKLRFD